MTILVCFAGQIGSGKSSVSTAVATALGWRHAGFGDYLRAEIERVGGDPTSREALQELGQKLIERDAEAFCWSVLNSGGFAAGIDFVIDGIRHVEILRILTLLAEPSTVRLLYLSADETHRLARISGRADKADFVRASMHRVEAELRNDLPAIADAVVDASPPFDEVVAACLGEIEAWRRR